MAGAVPEGWRVRVRGADGRICGAGVLVDSWRLVTCAHVVAEALQADPSGAPPSGTVAVDFPALTRVSRLAMVMTGGWVPVAADGRGDLAVLVLDEAAPDGLQPASLVHFGAPDGRTVRAYGHPAGQADGVWALTRPVGYGGPGGEWVQMDGLAVTGRRVERGFSGAGVLDENAVAVVGLIVAEDLDAPNRVAWMLPIEQVVRYLPPLALQLGTGVPVPDGEPPERLPGAAPERRLSNLEQRELRRRLVAVPDMLDRSARELYVHLVEQEWGEALAWRRQRDESTDVWALMVALLARPGSLRTLVAVLHGIHENSDEVAALEEFVERTFPDLLLEHRERAELEGLLAGVTRAWAGAAYRAASAPFEPVPAVGMTDVTTVVRHLEGFGRLRGGPPPPLLVFADDLAHKIGGPTSVQVHRWIDGVGDRLEVDRARLRQLCDAADARRDEAGQVVLAVQLQPDRVDSDRYLMSTWVHYGLEQRLLLRDDVARTLDEVIEQLDDLLPSVPEHVSVDIDELMIEFILPQRLIGQPVEQWDFDRKVFPRPLGIRYPVVVRSLERLRSLSWHDAWRRKWRWLTEHGHRADPAAIHCVGRQGDRDPRALYSDLGLEDHPVCLVLPFPPRENGSPAGGDEFVAGLAAGMPVIVWARHPVDPVRFCGLVRETFAADGLRELPRRMLRMRRNAARSADATLPESLGGFAPPMGLLWDDADRVPESFRRSVRLQAP